MQAGKLRHRITVQRPSTKQDAFGQTSKSDWQDVLSAYARVEAVSGEQTYAVGTGFTSKVSHKVTIRYSDAAITSAMRVLFGQRTFAVQYVENPEETREMLCLYCLEQEK